MASLAILLLLARISGSIAISSNNNYYTSRSSQQMIIASVAPLIVPDADGQQSAQQPFLTSPSGSYAAYLRRAADGNGGGGLGGDACYVQIQQAGAPAGSVWESDCTPVGGADACDLAFSPVGLELFAGGHSLWDTGVDADPATLSLDDDGDMSILSKDGVTVWRASGEPWTGQQCGAGAPLPASTSSSTDAVSPLSAISAKLVTPPAATLAGTTGTTDFSFGDQLAPPPVDGTVAAPDLPAQPPVDAVPEQPLAPPPPADLTDLSTPPAYTLPDSPDLPLMAPPPADVSPDLPLVAPPPADVSLDQPLYSSPPPAPALPPFGIPLAPPPGTDETLPGATTPPAHGEPGSPGGVPFSTPPPGGLPHKQGSPHHDLPVGATPPLPDTLDPSGHGEGAAGLPNGGGQPQQGVFGQQPQLLDSEGHPLPLEDSAAGRSSSEHGRVGIVLAAALTALCFALY